MSAERQALAARLQALLDRYPDGTNFEIRRSEAETTIAALTDDTARRLLGELVAGVRCWYDDHSPVCRQHYFPRPCPHERAKAYLAGQS